MWNQAHALFASCHWKEPQRKRKREREEGGEDGEVDGADINLTLAEVGWGTGWVSLHLAMKRIARSEMTESVGNAWKFAGRIGGV